MGKHPLEFPLPAKIFYLASTGVFVSGLFVACSLIDGPLTRATDHGARLVTLYCAELSPSARQQVRQRVAERLDPGHRITVECPADDD